jgi:hypothetical protein
MQSLKKNSFLIALLVSLAFQVYGNPPSWVSGRGQEGMRAADE